MTTPHISNTQHLLKTPLFDSRFYAQRVDKTFRSREESADHYLTVGWYLEHDPSARFDTSWLKQQYPEIAESGICPLLYVLKYKGDSQIATTPATQARFQTLLNSALFDVDTLKTQSDDISADKARAAYQYALGDGQMPPSRLFDPDYYRLTHPDVAKANAHPLLHYLEHGANEGRTPYERPRCEELTAIDETFRQGQPEAARQQLDAYIAKLTAPEPRWLLACILLAEISLLSGERQRCERLCQTLKALGWQAFYPHDYDRLCGFMVTSLCERGAYAQAREWILEAYQHMGTWHAAPLTRLRQTLQGPRDLALYAGIIEPQMARRQTEVCHYLLQYSLAARDTGNMPLALKLIEQRLEQGVNRYHRYGEHPPVKEKVWQVPARQALRDLKACLNKAGIEFFLVSGTLLGCVRDNDIIAHDKDIDIGVMAPISVSALTRACEGQGTFQVLPYLNDYLIRVKHANGVMADIFIHWQEDGRIHHQGRKTGWWNSPFTLTATTFLEESFLIPQETDRYLQENYGHWQVPDPNFDTFADTPNMYVVSETELQWYFLKTLLDHFVQGEQKALNSVASAALKACPDSSHLHFLINDTLAKSHS